MNLGAINRIREKPRTDQSGARDAPEHPCPRASCPPSRNKWRLDFGPNRTRTEPKTDGSDDFCALTWQSAPPMVGLRHRRRLPNPDVSPRHRKPQAWAPASRLSSWFKPPQKEAQRPNPKGTQGRIFRVGFILRELYHSFGGGPS